MKMCVILISLLIKFTIVENVVVSLNYGTMPTYIEDRQTDENEELSNEKVLSIKDYDDADEYELSTKRTRDSNKKPCAIIVLSNIQNPNVQSLLRKYRYDANGILIPSSVKYFIKLPQGLKSPMLVPLNDKAFSPQGGFVRYYKEVPPIPRVW